MEVLHEVGYPGYENIEEEEASKADAIFETVLGTVSKTFVDIFGSKSYIDFFLDLIVGALAKI